MVQQGTLEIFGGGAFANGFQSQVTCVVLFAHFSDGTNTRLFGFTATLFSVARIIASTFQHFQNLRDVAIFVYHCAHQVTGCVAQNFFHSNALRCNICWCWNLYGARSIGFAAALFFLGFVKRTPNANAGVSGNAHN